MSGWNLVGIVLKISKKTHSFIVAPVGANSYKKADLFIGFYSQTVHSDLLTLYIRPPLSRIFMLVKWKFSEAPILTAPMHLKARLTHWTNSVSFKISPLKAFLLTPSVRICLVFCCSHYSAGSYLRQRASAYERVCGLIPFSNGGEGWNRRGRLVEFCSHHLYSFPQFTHFLSQPLIHTLNSLFGLFNHQCHSFLDVLHLQDSLVYLCCEAFAGVQNCLIQCLVGLLHYGSCDRVLQFYNQNLFSIES